MALPVFNEGTMRYHDSETNKMMKTSVAESILAASKPALTAESTALATVSPVSTQMETVPMGPSPMSPMESTMAIFQSMADSLMNIESLLLEQNNSQEDQTALDLRDESIADADVVSPPDDPRDDDPINKKPGLLKRGFNKMGGRAGLLKAGLIAALAGVMLFSEQITKALAPILKFTKEKIFPVALAAFDLAMDGAKAIIDLLVAGFEKTVSAFKFLTDPETSLESKVEGVKTAISDFGSWLFGLFDGMATYVAKAFGMEFEEGETLGSWVGDQLKDGWANIKAWFEGIAPAWLIDGMTSVGAWVIDKATTAFSGIVSFFGGAVEAFKVDGFAGVYDYVKDKVLSAFQGPIDFFSGAIAAFKLGSENGEGGFATLGAWLKDKLQSPFKFLKDLFSFPEKPEEGFFSWEFGGKVMTKFIDLALLPANLAINFFKDIFGFSKDDAEKDPNYKPFSLGEFIVGKVSGLWDWLKSKFEFDIPTLKLPELPNISEMIGGVVGGMLPELDSWMWGPLPNKLKVWREMYDKNEAAAAMESVVNPSTAALASQTAMMDASGAGVAVYDYSNNTSTSSTSQDTYSASELGTDHQEKSGSWFSKVDWTFWD
jgi:hypothetical protein